jgi:hypothetical protein
MNWFSSRLSFDDKPVGVCPPLLVQHAADTSPPIFS